jgi:hypothetical protein
MPVTIQTSPVTELTTARPSSRKSIPLNRIQDFHGLVSGMVKVSTISGPSPAPASPCVSIAGHRGAAAGRAAARSGSDPLCCTCVDRADWNGTTRAVSAGLMLTSNFVSACGAGKSRMS